MKPTTITALISFTIAIIAVILGAILKGVDSSWQGRRTFRVLIQTYIKQLDGIEDEGIAEWHKTSVSTIQERAVSVGEDIYCWRKKRFYIAWQRYCGLTAAERNPNVDAARSSYQSGTLYEDAHKIYRKRLRKGLKAMIRSTRMSDFSWYDFFGIDEIKD